MRRRGRRGDLRQSILSRSPFRSGTGSSGWRVISRLVSPGILTTRPDDIIIDYLLQTEDKPYTRSDLKASLCAAKKALASILEKDFGGTGDFKTVTKLTTFSLPVVEQLVAHVRRSLRDTTEVRKAKK